MKIKIKRNHKTKTEVCKSEITKSEVTILEGTILERTILEGIKSEGTQSKRAKSEEIKIIFKKARKYKKIIEIYMRSYNKHILKLEEISPNIRAFNLLVTDFNTELQFRQIYTIVYQILRQYIFQTKRSSRITEIKTS